MLIFLLDFLGFSYIFAEFLTFWHIISCHFLRFFPHVSCRFYLQNMIAESNMQHKA